jgi:hypothetical protein
MVEMMVLRYFALLAAPFLVMSASHAETYPDCEKYDEPLAYNQCLASHGPSAAHALAAKTEEGQGVEQRPSQAGRWVHPAHGGRMSATFSIEDARPAYQHGGFRRRR